MRGDHGEISTAETVNKGFITCIFIIQFNGYVK